MKEKLLSKIESRTLAVAVVGLGYVGLPLIATFAAKGFNCTGFDVDASKVASVNEHKSYIGDLTDDELSPLVDSGCIKATTDFALLKDADFIAICVPSPLDEHGQPDMRFIESAACLVGDNISTDTIVVLESTTYPGTTEEFLKPIIEKHSNLKCEESFYLGFSPERVDPGNKEFNTRNTPKVVSGIGADAAEVIAAVYSEVLTGGVHTVSSPAVAEMEKILENTYRNVNIALVNEFAILCHKMSINIWEVIGAAKTKPLGFQAFYPGPGLGGHCIPLDPAYLSWKAREYSFHTSIIESASTINDRMPEYCVERAADILNDSSKALRGSRILVLGVAYKSDIADSRESASIELIRRLKAKGTEIDYHDPYVSEYREAGSVQKGLDAITPEIIAAYDLVIIATAHSNVDYEMIIHNAHAVFDTRNALGGFSHKDNIHLL